MITENTLPILEYDDTSPEVIAPDHDSPGLRLPETCVFAFLGSIVDDYALGHGAQIADEFITIAQTFRIYVLRYRGTELCLVRSPIGAPAAAQLLDTLITCGCRKIVALGSCGVLEDLPENAFLVPVRALRDEGTSYHYLPAARYIDLNPGAVAAITGTFERLGLPHACCTTWTTDGFFRETRDMVAHRRQEGCAVVEMECAALAACAEKRGGSFGQFLFTADSLADVHAYAERDFGSGSHGKALQLALEIAADWK